MGMSMTNRRLVGLLALAAAVAAGGGYAWARTLHMPQIVDIGSTACGVPETSPSFGVPLEAVMRVSGGLPFGVGPVEVPDGGGPISLRFEPALDGRAGEVRLEGATLQLPTGFGHDRQLPRRITLHCREGDIGSVRYEGDGGASTVFQVTRSKASARDPAAAPGTARRLPDLS
jgi:hypothetical protein